MVNRKCSGAAGLATADPGSSPPAATGTAARTAGDRRQGPAGDRVQLQALQCERSRSRVRKQARYRAVTRFCSANLAVSRSISHIRLGGGAAGGAIACRLSAARYRFRMAEFRFSPRMVCREISSLTSKNAAASPRLAHDKFRRPAHCTRHQSPAVRPSPSILSGRSGQPSPFSTYTHFCRSFSAFAAGLAASSARDAARASDRMGACI